MSVLAETFECVCISLTDSKNTLMWVWVGMRFERSDGNLWGVKQNTGGGRAVVLFESADFFMDQTYFSVCSYYVIIKDM